MRGEARLAELPDCGAWVDMEAAIFRGAGCMFSRETAADAHNDACQPRFRQGTLSCYFGAALSQISRPDRVCGPHLESIEVVWKPPLPLR